MNVKINFKKPKKMFDGNVSKEIFVDPVSSIFTENDLVCLIRNGEKWEFEKKEIEKMEIEI